MWDMEAGDWLAASATVVGAAAAGVVGAWIVRVVLLRLSRTDVQRSAVRRLWPPLRIVLPAVAVGFAAPALEIPAGAAAILRQAVGVSTIAGFTWMAVRALETLEDVARAKYDIRAKDNLLARRAVTRIQVIRKALAVALVVVGVGLALFTIPRVRELGAGILASAGVAGLLVALAARPTAENLFAGLQIALAQPINLDDVVVVEGEWGRIEEINATYVVVRIWDDRRLILPVTYFLQKPFENWTRTTASILGSVHLRLDYTAPVGKIREELGRLLASNAKWDRRAWGLQVTDADGDTINVRAVMTASDAPTAWDLRCEVREALLEYIRREHPGALPRRRWEPGDVSAGSA